MLIFLAGLNNETVKPARKWSLKPPLRDLLLVIALFCGLSVLFTWPMVLHLGEMVPGPPHQDQYQNLWNLWWAKFSLFNLRTNPFHTDYLLYPYGADLYLHTLDLTNGLLSVPFRLFSLVFAYNAVLFVGLVLTGVATYLFALELGLNRLGAVLAGILMVFSPVHLRYIKGEIEFVNFGWFIFYLLVLLKLEKSGPGLNWRYIVGGGLMIALAGYTSAYQLVWLGFITLFWLVKEVWLHRARVSRWFLNWLAGWALGLLLLSPWLVGGMMEFGSGRVHTEESLDYLSGAGVSLGSFLVPHYVNPLLTGNPAFNFLTNGSNLVYDNFFIGFGLIALAGVGLFFYLRRKEKFGLGFWLLTGLIFGILSLGPELYINTEGTGLPLPYRLFLELPFSRIVRNSARFSEVLLFGLVLAAGYGFQQLLARPRLAAFKYGKVALSVLVALIILLEFWKLPYPTNQIEIPPAYSNLQGNGAVLEIPLNKRDTSDAQAMAAQTVHSRPILPAYLSRRIDSPYENTYSPLDLVIYRANQPDIFNTTPAENALNILRIQGVGTIVFHRDQEKSAEAQEAFLDKVLNAPPYYKDGKISLYGVTPGPAGPAFVIGAGWYATEKDANGQYSRWAEQTADFDIYTAQAGAATLEFKAIALGQTHNIKILLNGKEASTVAVQTDLNTFLVKLDLQKGQNHIVLSGQEPAVSPRSLGQGDDPRLLNIQVRQVGLIYS